MIPSWGQDGAKLICHNSGANAQGPKGVLWPAGGSKGALTAADNP